MKTLAQPGLVLAIIAAMTTLAWAADVKPLRPDIYNRTADGKQQITYALAKAKAEQKNVLLKFGANWCGWCHKLSKLLKEDPELAQVLKANYVLVLIDVDQVDGKVHNAEVVQRYGNPTQFGLPVLVVLDAQGKQLTTQDTGKLEEGDHHDRKKVLAFLQQWKPRQHAEN